MGGQSSLSNEFNEFTFFKAEMRNRETVGAEFPSKFSSYTKFGFKKKLSLHENYNMKYMSEIHRIVSRISICLNCYHFAQNTDFFVCTSTLCKHLHSIFCKTHKCRLSSWIPPSLSTESHSSFFRELGISFENLFKLLQIWFAIFTSVSSLLVVNWVQLSFCKHHGSKLNWCCGGKRICLCR